MIICNSCTCYLISVNVGAIVGGVLGVVVVLAVIAFIVLIGLFCIPRNTKVAHEDDEKVLSGVYNREGGRVSYSTIVQCNSC